MPARKFLFRFLAIYAAAFVLVYLIPEHIHRRDFDRAFSDWLHDRTPQNEATLRVEQHKNERIKLADSSAVALAVVTLGSGVYFVFRFAQKEVIRRRSKAGIPLDCITMSPSRRDQTFVDRLREEGAGVRFMIARPRFF